LLPKLVTDDGNVMDVNAELLKQKLPKVVTDCGNVIDVNAEQKRKQPPPKLVTFDTVSKVTEFKLVQFSKQ